MAPTQLQDRRMGAFKLVHKVNDNANVLELLENLKVSPTFNVVDLVGYYPQDEGFSLLLESGESSSQGDIDAGA